MRTRAVRILAVLAAATFANSAASILSLPLTWVDRQAYVVTATLDDVAVQLQTGTIFPTAWVACGRSPFAGDACVPDRCDVTVHTETTRHCGVRRRASLVLGDANGTGVTVAEFPLRVAQYHNLSELNDTTHVKALSASQPDYTSEQPRLVTGAVGALGLGRAFSQVSLLTTLRSFSLFVTTAPRGSLLLLDVGTNETETPQSFAPSLVIANGWTATYTLPLRNATTDDDEIDSASSHRWDLSLRAVRFDEDALLYPRVYSWSEDVGGDAAATLSLNHAVLLMPTDVLTTFQAKYLTSCSVGLNTIGNRFFLCAASVQTLLPRITLYLDTRTFVLDPDDYTHVSPNNASALIVQLHASPEATRWVLGAPFLRKFPAHFRPRSRDVTLFCTAGVSCRPQSFGTMTRAVVDDSNSDIVSSRRGDGVQDAPQPSATPAPSPTQAQYGASYFQDASPVVLAAIWLGRGLAVLMLLAMLIRMVASCRDRLLGRRRGHHASVPDDTDTVASERDFEEAKEALRAMVAAEADAEANEGRDSTVTNDTTAAYARIQSPRGPAGSENGGARR